jgi:hypothetical protein
MITTRSPNFRHPRGSVMILVVAVLGLLAVLGTVYIVASRTQRASSAAMNADLNFTLARQGVLSTVQQVIGESMMDTNGNIGGIGLPNAAGTRYGARAYDYPELGGTFGHTGTNANMRDEPWLVRDLHPQNVPFNDVSLLTAHPFDPSTGTYTSLPAYPTAYAYGNTTYMFPYINGNALSTIVGDQTPLTSASIVNKDTTKDDPPTPVADGYINLLPFSDVTGVRYRYGVRIIDTSRMANLNTGATDDTLAKQDTLGQYLTSLRLAPAATDMDYTNNNYFYYGNDSPAGTGDGVTINSIDMKTALHQSQPATTSGMGRAGLSTANATFDLASWQQQVLRIESRVGTQADPLVSFFQPADELDLRAYGEYGTLGASRLTTWNSRTSETYRLWPYTLSNTVTSSNAFGPSGGIVLGNPRRRSYTTYSFSRQFRPYANPSSVAGQYEFALTPVADAMDPIGTTVPSGYGADSKVWALQGRLQQVNVNPVLSFSSAAAANDSMFALAATATNMATLMKYGCTPPPLTPVTTGNTPNAYTDDEVLAYTANSITFRSNGMAQDTAIAAATAYTLPYGPSYVDDKGIAVRTAVTSAGVTTPYARNFGPTTDATTLPNVVSGTTNRVYLGYAAQPFINEIAAQEGADSSAGPAVTVVKDVAFELHNPYSVALSLKGYHLKLVPLTGPATVDIDLSGQYVPAKGYLVVTATGSPEFATKVAATAGDATHPPLTVYPAPTLTPTALDLNGGNLVLYRTFYDRTNTAQIAPVDQMNYTTLVVTAGLDDLSTTPAKDLSIARGNNGAVNSIVEQWGAAINNIAARADATLGTANNNSGPAGYQLYDRYADTPALTQGAQFSSILEFNRIMRQTNVFDAVSGGDPTIVSLLPDKLAALSATTAPYNTMQCPTDSQLHFNFMAAPWIFNSTPTADVAAPPSKAGDIRAVHIFDQITLMDRVSDASIDLSRAGITQAIDKLRLPGQVNINTAYGDVLRALPGIQAMTTMSPNQAVANILAYRDRLATGAATATYPRNAGTTSSVDYSDQSVYPGYGFRSLAELLVVLQGPSAADDLQKRDAQWASVLNLCTVRSDTFIVYGYMEAVRANPAYTGTFNNASDWYGNVTDDPRDTSIGSIPLLRIAQRRWVALIDRSFCNYDRTNGNFTLPKVVAIKDLPQ